MGERVYEFEAVIEPVPDKGGAYVRFPYDIRKEFGKGRVKAEVTFDGEPYSGSIVNMGVKNEDGSVCYIIGIRKDIRNKTGKQPGDRIAVTVKAGTDESVDSAAPRERSCGNARSAGAHLRTEIRIITAGKSRRQLRNTFPGSRSRPGVT